ncbi:TRM11 family SAM-dependent methyltransferase [Streptomyces sp. L7]
MWNTAPTSAPAQRADRYVPGSAAHPAKMLPAIAAHAITTYTRPGDLILDPMCGIGTTLVEAIRLGRHALGTEYEARWADLARANVIHAMRADRTVQRRGRVRRRPPAHRPHRRTPPRQDRPGRHLTAVRELGARTGPFHP